jgi:hypothetical protein
MFSQLQFLPCSHCSAGSHVQRLHLAHTFSASACSHMNQHRFFFTLLGAFTGLHMCTLLHAHLLRAHTSS